MTEGASPEELSSPLGLSIWTVVLHIPAHTHTHTWILMFSSKYKKLKVKQRKYTSGKVTWFPHGCSPECRVAGSERRRNEFRFSSSLCLTVLFISLSFFHLFVEDSVPRPQIHLLSLLHRPALLLTEKGATVLFGRGEEKKKRGRPESRTWGHNRCHL